MSLTKEENNHNIHQTMIKEYEKEIEVISWQRETLKTKDSRNVFVQMRLLYPKITTLQWSDKEQYIRGLKYTHTSGRPYTFESFVVRWWWQNGKCSMCPRKKNMQILSPLSSGHHTTAIIDHNHKTRVARGILCNTCNSILRK